jgi:AraC-like DNA-binding protein
VDYAEQRASRALRPYLECLWTVSARASRRPRDPQRIVPDGCPELIVHFADPFSRRIGARWVPQRRAFLAGTLSRPWRLRAGVRVRTLGLRFRPGALTALFPVSMAAMADREVPLADVAGAPAARALLSALSRAGSDARRIAVADAWLVERLRVAPPRQASARPAVALILRERGGLRMAAMARALGRTPRQLERLFLRDLGIRPKLFARIVRLNAVLASLDEAERASAVDMALEAGYFDQAHLLRDFRTLAGRSPRAGSGADGELARHFTRPERLRALFAPE